MSSAQRHEAVSRRRRRCAAGQDGQVVPLVAVLLVLAGVLAAGLVQVGAAASRRAASQATADAVALAGAADGVEAARRTAADNGARLVSYREVGTDVVVTVQRRGVSATARARWEVAPPPAAPRPHGGPSPGSGWSHRPTS